MKFLVIFLSLILTACSMSEGEVEHRYELAGFLFGVAMACKDAQQINNSNEALKKFEAHEKIKTQYSKEKLDYFKAVFHRSAEETVMMLVDVKTLQMTNPEICKGDFAKNTDGTMFVCITFGDVGSCW